MKRPGKNSRASYFSSRGFLAFMTLVVALLIREWRFTLILLCMIAIGGLIALLMRWFRRDENITVTNIR